MSIFSGHQLEKKYLIVFCYQTGHQIREALAKEGGAWVNLHFVTLPSLAQEVATIELSKQKIFNSRRSETNEKQKLRGLAPL
jgi:hypothetical protein